MRTVNGNCYCFFFRQFRKILPPNLQTQVRYKNIIVEFPRCADINEQLACNSIHTSS